VASHRGCSLRPFADRYGLSVAQTWTVLSVALRGDLVRDVSRDGRRFQLRVTDAGTALLGERVTR
jgi:Cu/Ag efflux pump CusA